jgi:hypothetical protein
VVCWRVKILFHDSKKSIMASHDAQSEANAGAQAGKAPSAATDAVLKPSDPVPEGATEVSGIDFNQYAGRDVTVPEMVAAMANMGFQASAVGDAVRIIDGMVSGDGIGRGRSCDGHITDHRCWSCREPGVIPRPARRRPSSWATPPTSSPRAFGIR